MTEEKKINSPSGEEEKNVTKGASTVEEKNTVKVEAEANNQESTGNVTASVQPKKKKGKRTVFKGQAHIHCTYNNTMITITDMNGATLGWSSSGLMGFKGAKKSTPFAATKVAADVSEKIKKYGVQELMIFIKGVGGGRESSIRGLAGAGFGILSIKDTTPHPHNGCRKRRPRRV